MRSAAATKRWGRDFSPLLQPGDVVCLHGPLGAGKTTLSQGIAEGLGVVEPVTSPTYTLINEYVTPAGLKLLHMDLYRLSGPEEFELIGGFEALDSDAVCLLEWSERLGGDLPEKKWSITLDLHPQGRTLAVLAPAGREVSP